jgi:hypothetical protein
MGRCHMEFNCHYDQENIFHPKGLLMKRSILCPKRKLLIEQGGIAVMLYIYSEAIGSNLCRDAAVDCPD